MSPFPTVGKISFTKYTQPDEMIAKLASLEPGVTTSADVEALLDNGQGSTPGPLFNDVVSYDPPLTGNAKAGTGVVVDDELLRACRAGRPEAGLLLWCALNIADRRLDRITRTILTDSQGRIRPEMVNRTKLQDALTLDDLYSEYGANLITKGKQYAKQAMVDDFPLRTLECLIQK